MRNVPQRVSEEQFLWVQVTPYHLLNSVNLPRHLLHSTVHQLKEENPNLAELDKHFVEANECFAEVLKIYYIWNILKGNIC